jgi:hypothetical protein
MTGKLTLSSNAQVYLGLIDAANRKKCGLLFSIGSLKNTTPVVTNRFDNNSLALEARTHLKNARDTPYTRP